MSQQISQEKLFRSGSGYFALMCAVVIPILAIISHMTIVFIVGGITEIIILLGFYMLQPNLSAVITLFGNYIGTDRGNGLRWANPLYHKTKLTLRAQNLISEKLKVNDKSGNPIEIAAAIVWRIHDTAQASFDVQDVRGFTKIQAEAAIRHVASNYAYDDTDAQNASGKPEITLRGSMDEVAASMVKELELRLARAGVVVEDAKLTHLAYAPEIASVMLRKQQAEAILSARTKIVMGAVNMVELALDQLSARKIVELDDERKAAMVSNLLVVLCSDGEAQPVINTGTLYT